MAGLGMRGDRLAIRDLRFVGDDFQIEASLEPMLHDVEVELAHADDDHLLGLGVADELEGRIFVGDLVQAAGDFLFVAAGLRFDGQAEHGRRIARTRQLRSAGGVAERVADAQILDLGDGDDIAGNGLGDRLLRLALHEQQAAAARRFAGADVDNRLLGRDLAGQDAEEAQVADELVRQRLENLGDALGRVAGLNLNLDRLVAGALRALVLVCLKGRGEVLSDRLEQLGHADVLVLLGGGAEDGDHSSVRERLGQSLRQFLGRNVALKKVFFHQGIVAFDDGVDELRASGRQIDRTPGRLFGGRIENADHAAERGPDSDRSVEEHAGLAENFADVLQKFFKVNVVVVEAVDDHSSGDAALARLGEHAAGVDLNAGRGRDDDDRQVRPH